MYLSPSVGSQQDFYKINDCLGPSFLKFLKYNLQCRGQRSAPDVTSCTWDEVTTELSCYYVLILMHSN
jgi:hypothetical protein